MNQGISIEILSDISKNDSEKPQIDSIVTIHLKIHLMDMTEVIDTSEFHIFDWKDSDSHLLNSESISIWIRK